MTEPEPKRPGRAVMISRIATLRQSHWASKLSDLFGNFRRWWLRELLFLFPDRFAEWLIDTGSKRLILVAEPDQIVLHLQSENRRSLASMRIDPAQYAPGSI